MIPVIRKGGDGFEVVKLVSPHYGNYLTLFPPFPERLPYIPDDSTVLHLDMYRKQSFCRRGPDGSWEVTFYIPDDANSDEYIPIAQIVEWWVREWGHDRSSSVRAVPPRQRLRGQARRD